MNIAATATATPTATATASAAMLTVDALVRQRAVQRPDHPAIVENGAAVSYGQLMQRVDRLAHALRARGVVRGDRIAVLSENRREYLELMLAAGVLGAMAACHNARQAAAELDHALRLTEPALAVVSGRHAEQFMALGHTAREVLVFGADYERALARADEQPLRGASEAEDGLLIMFTSGTTGHAKGAVLSHRAELARAMIATADGMLHPGRGSIVWSPLYHIAGAEHALGLLMQGDTVFLVDGFQPPELVELMTREVLGTVSLMPAAIGRVIDELKRTGQRPKGLMACGSMADLVPRHQIAEASGLLNAPFRNSFGATETGQAPASRGRFPIGVVPERMSKTQSSFCALRLVDEEDCDVAPGSPGEVLIRGPSLFSGYWNASEVTAHDFRGGWFHMGDVMLRNPDGTLDFVDRRKYLIKSGGENIYPAEVERVLMADRRIKDVAIVRRADPHWGEVPVAFVVAADLPGPDAPALTAAAVIDICRGQVANYKLPKDVVFIADDEMPRNDTSKVKRNELEARLRDGMGVGIGQGIGMGTSGGPA
jgi:acyl-CoA synthetase (AMP-forming)/AMP-acid ligase II